MNYTVIRCALLSGFLLAAVLTLMAADTAAPPAPPIGRAAQSSRVARAKVRGLRLGYFFSAVSVRSCRGVMETTM